MLQTMIEKRFIIQSIALCAVFFFVCAMKPADPVKKTKKSKSLLQRLKRVEPVPLLVNCGLTHHLISKEVMALISYHLTLQDLGRLNRVKKSAYWDLEYICDCKQKKCESVACIRLQQCHYDIRTKVLAHYYKTKNSAMVSHLMCREGDVRWAEEKRTLDRFIAINRHMYRTTKKIHKQRLIQLELALRWRDKEQLSLFTNILKGSDFNIFDSGKKYRKKQVRLTCTCFTLRSLFSQICYQGDVELLLAVLGGFIEPRAFKYVFKYAGPNLMRSLIGKNVFPRDVSDKRGRDFDDYMQQYAPSRESIESEFYYSSIEH